jgi:hypothetical protein
MMRPMFVVVIIAALAHQAVAQAGAPPPSPPPSSDDLSKAADATAEAAAVGAGAPGDMSKAADATAAVATVPAAPEGSKPSADDIDLSALGLDPGASAFDDKLNLYGFADISYAVQHFVRAVPTIPQDTRSFGVGNLNVYLARNLIARARVLAEIRFTFVPNGTQNADGTYVNTTAQDLSNFVRPVQWGGIVIERLYAEYDLTPHLTVRAGHWLTPYGVWNIDHGSPAIVATNRPYIIGEQFFPEHQTGLDVFGTHYISDLKLSGHLTVSNGRGGTEAVTDQDNKLAFGGRAELETPWGLKVGGSYYRGRYTALPAAVGVMPETFREASYGGDAQYKLGALHFQGEVIARERHYVAGQRSAGAAGFVPDGRDFGLYALADYRFDQLWNVTPYGFFELYQPGNGPYFSGLKGVNLGLNFRPAASLVLKLQANRTQFDGGPELLADQKIYYFSTQVSWVF